ncbi:MAG: hypothetical protein LBQ90_08765 [Synergistaceae bacterium]|nr:hypothetical protein [Synergistaceae bacterium]
MKKYLFLPAALLVLFAFVFTTSPAFAAESLSIQKLLFADEIMGLGQYTPRSGARFTLDDECWVYIEVANFAMPLTPNTQDEYNIDLAVDVRIKLPQSGRQLTAQPDITKLTTRMRTKLPTQFLSFGFSFEGWTPGNYALEIRVRDNLGGQAAVQDLLLQVAEPTEADIRARQEREAQQQKQ